MTPITREIAKRVAATHFEDIPPEVVQYSKTLAMSALGAMIAGPACRGSDIITRYIRRTGGAAEATPSLSDSVRMDSNNVLKLHT